MKKSAFKKLSLYLLSSIILASPALSQISKFSENIQNSLEKRIIVLNPGHGPTSNLGFGAQGKDTSEYFLNLKLSNYIKNEFSNDCRFEVVLTKDSLGFNTDLESKILDINSLNEIKTTMRKIKPEIIRGVKYHGTKKKTPGEIITIIYSTRKTAEDHLDPEIIISPHHDAATKRDSGYSILISPRNFDYENAEKLALKISKRLSNVSTISTKMINDSLPNWPKLEPKRKELEKQGIVFRTRLPELGDIRYWAKKPKLIIEYEFAKRISITDEDYFKTRAHATYLGILDYFDFKKITMDDRLERELKKTEYQPRFLITDNVKKVCGLRD